MFTHVLLGTFNMLLLINVLLTLWVSCAEGQERTCNFPEIKHGRTYGENQQKQNFPVAIGKYFYYTCDHSYVSASQSLWTRITCTEEGWSPTPKCRRLCFFPSVENGHSSSSGQIHLEGDTVQILCAMGYKLANYQSSITCTEDDWSSPPKCSPAELWKKQYSYNQKYEKEKIEEESNANDNKSDSVTGGITGTSEASERKNNILRNHLPK
ncbi:complement factor H-related protein 2-like [Dugong dugon]